MPMTGLHLRYIVCVLERERERERERKREKVLDT